MKAKYFLILLIPFFILLACSFRKGNLKLQEPPEVPDKNRIEDFGRQDRMGGRPGAHGGFKQESSGVESIEIADKVKYLSEDCVENYKAVKTVAISFNGKNAIAEDYEDSDGKKVTLYLQKDVSGDDAEAQGIIIEYKGTQVIRYALSGNLSGTLKIKNKNADCIVELNGVNITSSATGPALHLTSEDHRTFIVVKEGSTNTLTDSRVLNQKTEMLNDKKGSVYAKGPVIFSGSTSKSSGGKLTVNNTGYKHAVYSHDYIRIQPVDLTVLCNGETSRDCIRALNAVIIDGGNINLKSLGTIYDDEGCGIKVEGEDADEDKLTVEYTAGAGFIVINGGTIKSETTSKGITAHWKYAETSIGKENYKETKNKSVLYGSGILNQNAQKPEPYLIINGGKIDIKTTLTPYENSDGSCSPEGIEAKYDLIINDGEITVNSTDDSLNAGGAITINGGKINVVSTLNDAIDANGPSGITINGGVIFASGTSNAECAFDCDNNPLTINGGTLIGLGSSNTSIPSNNSNQKVFMIGSSDYEGKKLTIKQNGKTVFEYEIPSRAGEVMIISSPLLQEDDYKIYGDKKEVTSGKISEAVTKINVNTRFGGGRGGMGGPRGMEDRGNFRR